MGPSAPAPLTRAAARKSPRVDVDKSDVRPRLMHVLALSGGAFAGALIVLGIGSLVGVPSMDSPTRDVSNREQIAVPTPSPTAVSPTPRSTPSAEPADEVAEPAPPAVVAPVASEEPAPASPAPEPTESTPDPVVADPAPETGPGKSATAPGRNKPPTSP